MCSRRRSMPSIAVGEHHEGSFGVYMQHKISKLQRQHQASFTEDGAVVSRIFEGVVAYVDGLTDPPILELRRLLYVHGGTLEAYQVAAVTHIICDYLPDSKVKELRRKKRCLPHVMAKWVVDSIEQGKKLPVANYLVPGLRNQHGGAIGDALYKPTTTSDMTASSSSSSSSSSSLAFSSSSSSSSAAAASSSLSSSSPAINASATAMQEPPPELKLVRDGSSGRDEPEPFEGPPSDRRVRSTKADPNFMQHYFNTSRLHFIGSWKARFQELAPILRAQSHQTQQDHQRIMQSTDYNRRVVLHIDMDCFFVSVLLRNRPDLKGKPVGVAHSGSIQGNGSSDVSSCNYEARQYGVHNGMFMGTAKALCPDLVVLSYDFEQYQQVSEAIYKIFFRHAPVVQPVSVDEVFLELTPESDGMQVAATIRREIFETTQCTASAGVSCNMLLARLATRKAKPNGQYKITLENAKEELRTLDIDELPGVGWSLFHKMREHGIHHVSDLWQYRKGQLQEMFGAKIGEQLYLFSRGEDRRKLQPVAARKSVGVDVNWGVRFTEQSEVKVFLRKLSGELHDRLEEVGYRGRTLTLKLKHKIPGWVEPPKFLGHGPCESYSKSVTLASATTAPEVIHREGYRLYQEFNFAADMIVGIGLQMTKLEPIDADQAAVVHETAGVAPISKWLVPRAQRQSSSESARTESMERDQHSGQAVEEADLPAQDDEGEDDELEANDIAAEDFDLESDFELELPAAQPSRQCSQPEMRAPSSPSSSPLVRSPRSSPSVEILPPAPQPADSLTFSQLDPTVLAELPSAIVQELKANLPRRKKQATVDEMAASMPPPPPPPPPPPAQRKATAATDRELPALDLSTLEPQHNGKRARQVSMEVFQQLWKAREEPSLQLTGLSQPVSAEVLDELPLALRLEILGIKPPPAASSNQPATRSSSSTTRNSKAAQPGPVARDPELPNAKRARPASVPEAVPPAPPAPLTPAAAANVEELAETAPQPQPFLTLDKLFCRESPSDVISALSDWLDAISTPQAMHVCLLTSFAMYSIRSRQLDCCASFLRSLRRLCSKHRDSAADNNFDNDQSDDCSGLPACVAKAAQLFEQRNAESPDTRFENLRHSVEAAAQLECKRLYGYALQI